MNKTTLDAALLAVSLDRSGGRTLTVQLVRRLRRLILEGTLTSGVKLPSSRTLAEELSLARSTVVAAFDQLVAEGYVEGRRGSGLYVAANLPDDVPAPPRPPPPPQPLAAPTPAQPFHPTAPDLAAFPHEEWARLFDRIWRRPAPELLAQADPSGYAPLRTALSVHLAAWRGIACEPRQVIVTSGLQEAVAVLARFAVPPQSSVLMEDPGYPALKAAITRNGLTAVPVPVDDQGFNVRAAGPLADTAQTIVITPSRHYPLGMTLPLARRLDLLEWARRTHALLIEDDYDSEYRFEGQPLPALMSLDDQRVIYFGSFSKVMFPALRLSFMVVPDRLADAAAIAIAGNGAQASLIAQPVLARFMESGAFAAHLRRMRRLYARRQKVLVAALRSRLAGRLEPVPATSGMHLIARLSPALQRRMSDTEASRRAMAHGLMVQPVSAFSFGAPVEPGLVLGFAGFSEEALIAAVDRLAEALA
jgi:GntR family transcriptional regulator/MocR family aminotransferase